MDVVPVVETAEERLMGVLGWILAVILVALMLPLLAFVYLDNLSVNKRTEKNLDRTEKLERQVQELKREIERKERDKKPDSFDDNPVFDRVRKPLSLRMSRPDKLE